MIFALTLSDIVELIIGAIWLIGFIGAIIVGILGRKRGNNSFETQSEPLNLDSGLMNAKKLNRKEGRENDEQ